jgi:hypothetical protein
MRSPVRLALLLVTWEDYSTRTHPALIRAAAVIAIAATAALGHVTFAAACPDGHTVATLDVETTGSIGLGEVALADNCYFDVVPELRPGGRPVTMRVLECD